MTKKAKILTWLGVAFALSSFMVVTACVVDHEIRKEEVKEQIETYGYYEKGKIINAERDETNLMMGLLAIEGTAGAIGCGFGIIYITLKENENEEN